MSSNHAVTSSQRERQPAEPSPGARNVSSSQTKLGLDASSEVRELVFRCAKTGQKFRALLGRAQPTHRFRVLMMEPLPKPGPKNSFEAADVSACAKSIHSFDRRDFDLSSWFCPCCGHSRDRQSEFMFVRCGTCKEYVCGARTIKVGGGPATFACHNGCRGGGRLERFISSLEGSPQQPGSRSASAQIGGDSPQVALPSNPASRLPRPQ
jgi:hypothetical protein